MEWTESPSFNQISHFWVTFPGHFHHVKCSLHGTCWINHCELFSALLIHQLYNLGRFIHTTTISETLCWALKILTPGSGHTLSLVPQSSESHQSSGMQTFLFKLFKVNHVRFSPLWQPIRIFFATEFCHYFQMKNQVMLKNRMFRSMGSFSLCSYWWLMSIFSSLGGNQG